MKTVLAPNAPWPKSKVKLPHLCDVSEAVITPDAEFKHPLSTKHPFKKKNKKDLKLDQSYLLDKARKQLENFETRKSVRKTVHLNLKRKKMTFASLELDVIRWSEARQIIPNSTAFAQAIKATEEINELVDALRDNNRKDAIDAVGDTMVCLINVCALLDVNLTECLKAAYQEIKDRKGYMNEDGIFVKQS